MNNERLRITISFYVFKIYAIYMRLRFRIETNFLRLPTTALVLFHGWAVRRRRERVQRAWHDFKARAESALCELQAERLPQWRKSELKTICPALLEEHKRLLVLCSELTSYRTPGIDAMQIALESLSTRMEQHLRKIDSFSKLLDRIETDTFYSELLLWFVVPMSRSEELVGDLHEEYVLRQSTDGPASATAWFKEQVRRTLTVFLWARFQRWTAIANFVDLLDRWFRR